MPLLNEFQLGDLKLSVYTFQTVGDTLPKHTHTKDTVHIVVVARGSVRFNEDVYTAGAIIDIDEGYAHEIVAVEADSRVVNIRKYNERNI